MRIDLSVLIKSEVSQDTVTLVIEELEDQDYNSTKPVEAFWPISRLGLEEEDLSDHKNAEYYPVVNEVFE